MRFYTADWRGDAGLRAAGFAARGLWIDMISLMHEATPYGHLLLNGQPMDAALLADCLGGTAKEVQGLLERLAKTGVYSRTPDGVLFSRRMVAEATKAEQDKLNGKGGGNPTLKKNLKNNPEDNGWVNPQDNREVKAHARVPESRVQSPIEEKAATQTQAREPSPEEPDRNIRPIMPCRGDPPHRWVHLGDSREIDDAGATHGVVGGYHLDAAADQVCTAARIRSERWSGDWRPLIGWLRDGIELPDIVDAVRRVAARRGYSPPGSLAYFDQAVRERIAA